jgi:hypothetical protein
MAAVVDDNRRKKINNYESVCEKRSSPAHPLIADQE